MNRPLRLQGNLLGYLERMNEEFIKILQNTDAHSTDYLTKLVLLFYCVHVRYTSSSLLSSPLLLLRLQAERRITDIIDRTLKYLEKQSTSTNDADLCRIYIMRIEHLYYKARMNLDLLNEPLPYTCTLS